MADVQAQPPGEAEAKSPGVEETPATLRKGQALVWLRRHAPCVLLALLGLAMLVLGVFVQDSDAPATALVLLGPLIVVVGVLLDLFSPRLRRLALSRSGLSLELDEVTVALERAGLPAPVAEALEMWIDNVTRLLPIEIDRRVKAALDARERSQEAIRKLAEQMAAQQRGQTPS